jgi:hypothetical protein
MKRASGWSGLIAGVGLVALAALVGFPAADVSAQRRPPRATPTPTATPQPAATEVWVQNHEVTEQWSGPNEGAVLFGWLRKFSYLRVERTDGERLYVYNPRTENFAYVNASAVGPSGPPPPNYLEPFKVLATINVPGRFVGASNIYAEPVADEAVWLRTAGHNVPVFIEAEVAGEGGSWYRLDTGEFVSGADVRLPRPTAARSSGKWIDADLSDPTMVTAYEGERVVGTTLAIRGTTAWSTPVGTYRIWRRVANETMSSEGLGIPRNAPGGYYVQNVLFTQYFTTDGAAIHYNYWSGNFGYPGSHGCLGMNYADSLWFWNWADIGTPIVVHY